jgi:prepilin peptidase CpaA
MLHYFFSIFVVVSFLWDLKTRKLPNQLCFVGAVTGIYLQFIIHGLYEIFFLIYHMFLITVVSLVLYVLGGIGGGDLKWFVVSSVYLCAFDTLKLMMYSILIAAIYGLVWFYITRNPNHKWTHFVAFFHLFHSSKSFRRAAVSGSLKQSKIQIPFMTAVLPAWLILYYQPHFFNIWRGML